MPVTATRLTDSEHAPRLEYRGGLVVAARETYRVDTPDEKLVLTATGLPAEGAAYDAGYPTLKVRAYSIRYEEGDYHLCEVVYEVPGGVSVFPRPEPDLAYTHRTFTTETITVSFAEDAVIGDAPIAGGDGAPKEVTRCELAVVIYRSIADYNAAADDFLIDLFGTTNDDTVNLPAVFGTTVGLTFAAGELRYRSMEVASENGLVKITHNLVYSPSHVHVWWPVDSEGLAIGGAVGSLIYPEAEWPAGAFS